MDLYHSPYGPVNMCPKLDRPHVSLMRQILIPNIVYSLGTSPIKPGSEGRAMNTMHTPHYHIRWSRVTALDWECFSTQAEAEARAKELVRQEEAYTIEEHDGACPRCQDAVKLKSARQ